MGTSSAVVTAVFVSFACGFVSSEETEEDVSFDSFFCEDVVSALLSSAISVVFINKGDDLWSICKKACAPEQVILADNPNLTFPVNEDKAVVVYRKIN